MLPTNKLLEIRLKVSEGIVIETLTRIGIVDRQKMIIYQSCHLFKQFGTYYLAHFKQLFTMATSNGYHGFGNVSLEDIERRNSIAFLLTKWNMIEVVNPAEIEPHGVHISVVSHADSARYRKVKKFHTDNLTAEEI